MELNVRMSECSGPGALPVEVVERKGIGHPDTICDALAEAICVHLCRHYQERFGIILHHNVDKLLLCGGASRPRLGGGEIIQPCEIILAGRATSEHRGERIPIAELGVEACRAWLRENLPDLDDQRVKITSRIRPGSSELTRLFARGYGKAPLANDTSYGAGFAPFTDLERVVLEVASTLNRAETRRANPAIGADVKVMGVRRGARIELTIGCAFIDRFVGSIADYIQMKDHVRAVAIDVARCLTELRVDAFVNVADDIERSDVFLTVTGTSAEAGDDGQVGRGNRVSGLITPYRPMTLEAAAGKNPVSHVGKLYNVVARRVSAQVAERLGSGVGASCVLVSQIGRPIDDPQVVDVCIDGTGLPPLGVAEGLVREIVRAELARLPELRDTILAGQETLY